MAGWTKLPHVPVHRQRRALSAGTFNRSSATPWHIRMFRHTHRNRVRAPMHPAWGEWFRNRAITRKRS